MKTYGEIQNCEDANVEQNVANVGLLLPLEVSESALESGRMVAYKQAHAEIPKAPEEMDRQDQTEEVIWINVELDILRPIPPQNIVQLLILIFGILFAFSSSVFVSPFRRHKIHQERQDANEFF
jgi:hypothetical protein